MMYDLDILRIISNAVKPEKGKILISEPLLNDEYFGRSVVLLAGEHNDSFYGFVLNKPSDKRLSAILDGIEIDNIPVYIGGPVETDILFCLHSFDFIPDAIHVAGNIYAGGDFDDIKQLVNSGFANNSNIRFFLGNSGWAPGQLNDEIDFNSWLVAKSPEEFVFSQSVNLWAQSLAFVDKRYEIWKNFPVDPELN